MANKDIQVGDKVQWNYGGGHPQGTAAEIKTQPGEKVQIETKKGNVVSRNANEDNPAVRVERRGEGNGADVVKRMSELNKVGEGGGSDTEGHKAAIGEKEPEVGEKRGMVGEGGKEVETTEEGGALTKAATQEKEKEPDTKKARLDEEPGSNNKGTETAVGKPPPPTKSTRGRRRGRGKETAAGTTTSARRRTTTSSRKKGATANTGDKVEGAKKEAVAEATETVEQGADVDPAGHTRSKEDA